MTFPDLITTFGPLIFVLFRAALCRKRILFLAPVPVEQTCHFGTHIILHADIVYNTSVLATIPPSVSDLLVNEPNRLRTLFSVGINDIPMLEHLASERPPTADTSSSTLIDLPDAPDEQGWVACTTDAVLAFKTHLYDILVTLPHHNAFPSIPDHKSSVKIPTGNNHPTLTSSTGDLLKPTLRDLRRWKRLRMEMPLPKPSGPDPDFDDLQYQRTWADVICSGLFWWATAGEAQYSEDMDNDEDDDYFLAEPPARRGTLGEGVPLLERSETLDSLLAGFDTARSRSVRQRSDTLLSRPGFGEADVGAMVYFHRMTARMVSSLSAVIDANELAEEGAEGTPATRIGGEDLMRMGLDWTERDFVQEMCRTWFGRDVVYDHNRSDCCYY